MSKDRSNFIQGIKPTEFQLAIIKSLHECARGLRENLKEDNQLFTIFVNEQTARELIRTNSITSKHTDPVLLPIEGFVVYCDPHQVESFRFVER